MLYSNNNFKKHVFSNRHNFWYFQTFLNIIYDCFSALFTLLYFRNVVNTKQYELNSI